MTLRDVLQGRPTLEQLDILQRADWALWPTGRYYGGQLTVEMVTFVDPPKAKHKERPGE